MAIRTISEISSDTRWHLETQRDNPIVQDYRRANELAVHYQEQSQRQQQRITQLVAENEALTVILAACTEGTELTYSEVPETLSALKQDAERYRWDRDNFMRENPNEYESTEDFDAEIDAAMAKGEA